MSIIDFSFTYSLIILTKIYLKKWNDRLYIWMSSITIDKKQDLLLDSISHFYLSNKSNIDKLIEILNLFDKSIVFNKTFLTSLLKSKPSP